MESSYVSFYKFLKSVSISFFILMSDVSHPVSLYKLSNDTSFVVPVAIPAASVWIFSRSSFSYCVQLSQIVLPYSKKGLMKGV